MDIVKSLYELLGSGATLDADETQKLGGCMADHINRALDKREPGGKLRASNLGTKCKRKLWAIVNKPEEAEPFNGPAKNKFLFGHLIEEYHIAMLKKAGFDVKCEQETVSIEGIEGHLDCIVNGVLTDVKSANSRGFDKFRTNGLEHDDPFGYLEQLDFYRAGLYDNPLLKDKEHVQFLAIDKELGHIVVDKYNRKHVSVADVRAKIKSAIDVCNRLLPPDRGYFAVPDGKSGNMQLDMPCRYCEYKWWCWPSLRMFIYSNGPRWLTKVVRDPDVQELKRPNV